MIKRRPNAQPFSVTPEQAQKIKSFNKEMIYTQGFRQQLAASSTTTLNITLFAAGRMLLGISVLPISSGDISDTQVTFLVNNNNVLSSAAAQNLNPNFVGGGMIYFPVPQPLIGNDNLQANFIKNDAGTVNVFLNVFYLPRI